MNSLENANVFCINPNGVTEGCHFLALVTCRPFVTNSVQDLKRRCRTNSLPPSLEILYESESTKGVIKGKNYDLELPATTPSRSLSENVLRLSQRETFIRDTCLQCISDLTESFNKHLGKPKRSRRPGVASPKVKRIQPKRISGLKNGAGVVAKSKRHLKKYIMKHPSSEFGFQCSGAALQMDGYVLSYLVAELKRSPEYRASFIRRWTDHAVKSQALSRSQEQKQVPKMLVFVALMKCPESEVLDLLGNKMVNSNILYRRSLEHALSWLSTLGGAFSALGDLSPTYAEEAGHVSITQLRIAMKLGDPGIQSRCRLYAAISLLQRGYLKSCRDIVKNEYEFAMSSPDGSDPRLRRMCLGIWSKLQYHWKLVASSERKLLKSTKEGLKDMQCNSKYRNVYNLEENRKLASYEDCV